MAKVLLAEDDPLTLAGIELLLSASNYQVGGTARTGGQALEMVPTIRPDMLILDYDMPERNGLDVLRALRSRGDMRPVVLLTGSINEHRAQEAMQSGVDGLVIKANAPRDLLMCLDAVAQGRRWFDQEMLQRAMAMSQSPDRAADPLARLSPRERAIAGLVQRGLRNRDVAGELGLTEGTVKVHLHKIFEKLGVQSRLELVLLAQTGENADAA